MSPLEGLMKKAESGPFVLVETALFASAADERSKNIKSRKYEGDRRGLRDEDRI